MKRGTLLVGVSVGLNVVLAVLLLKPAGGPVTNSDRPPANDGQDAVAPGARDAHDNVSADRAKAWRTLYADDPRTFAANLRAAGLSDLFVRAVVRGQIDERYRVREAALATPQAERPYWQFNDTKESLETKLARMDLKREKAQLFLDAVGADPALDDGNGIPAAKRELAHMIAEDYDTLIGDIAPSHYSILLPSERAMVERLQQEKERELRELLTREEMIAYLVQHADIAEPLKRELRGFAPTEAEFRAIVEARNEFNTRLRLSRFDRMNSVGNSLMEVHRKTEDDIRTALGEDRYRDYLREKDPNLQSVRELADRVGLPREAADRVHELRSVITRESKKIGRDTTQSAAARRAALAELGTKTRREIETLLGPEASAAYFFSANQWLGPLEQGNVVELEAGSIAISGVIDDVPPAGGRPPAAASP